MSRHIAAVNVDQYGFRLAEEGTLEGMVKEGVEAEPGVRLLLIGIRLENAIRAMWAPPAQVHLCVHSLGQGRVS